jgi:tetratricopeptide (TPR) repeat protein
MRLQLGIAVLMSLSVSQAAFALRIEYGADRQAELAECDRSLYLNRRTEAQSCYRKLLNDNADVRIKAEAARALGDQRAANGYFQTALSEYPDDAAVRTRWGDLFVQTHQNNEAVKLYQESLAIDSEYAPALLGLAKVAVGRFESKAREWIAAALEISDDNIEAYLLLARMDLEEGAVDTGEKSLNAALEIAERTGAPPLEIYALKAAVDLLRDIEPSEWTERALAYNPNYGGAYAIPAYYYVITRRYREAIALYRQAVAIEPDLYDAHAELGVNLLRENKVEEAQRHLAVAYSGDPFNRPTVNTLRLIDSLDRFNVTRHGAAAEDSAAASGDPAVILRLHQDESAVLEPYVLKLVNSSIATFSERYGFELKEPVIVELYPEHDDFAVRTAGLPGIGLLGVTFGYLVAMDSPSGRAPGEFHWGTTLWHEMAHVFTLEATAHLVPRWFSEGVSVFEEWSTGPLPGRHIPPPVLQAIKEDKLLPIAELDRGFIRPSYENQVIVSYMQAGLICEYIAANWGQEALGAMLGRYAEGLDTAAAVESATGISAAQFDERFAAFIESEFAAVIANLESWQKAQQEAHELAGRAAWPEALSAATRAIELYPDYVDDGSAYLVLAKAQNETDERGPALETLREYRRLGGSDPGALKQLAQWLADADSSDEAIAALQDLILVAPLDEDLHRRLGDSLLDRGDAEQALAEYEALFAMNPHDQAGVHFRLAKAFLQLQDRGRSREHLLYALEIAPHYREAQQLLLEIVR